VTVDGGAARNASLRPVGIPAADPHATGVDDAGVSSPEALMRTLSLAGLAFAMALTAACDAPPAQLLAPDDAAFARGGKAATAAPIRMLSRNLYLGADIDRVLSDPVGGPALAFQELMYTDYPSRAAVLAQEIASRRPQLVGLQEVANYDIFIAPGGVPMVVQSIPFLDILLMHLGALGMTYNVVVLAENIEVTLELPFEIEGFPASVTYTDSDAILVELGVQVHDSGDKHFDAQVMLPGIGPNLRSYQWADVTVEGERFLFVNTHLEVQGWAEVQELQTAELLAFVDDFGGPVFMVGDFNSAANRVAPARARTATYGMILDAGFDDLWLPHNGVVNNSGLTCCQASDLSNRPSALDQRIDFIFARDVAYWKGNRSAAAKLDVFGDRPSDRFLTDAGYYLWPSDHAGIFGEILLAN
jgi:endonuclease/exonuclease/phosphatase family metal-dependent hydrolase